MRITLGSFLLIVSVCVLFGGRLFNIKPANIFQPKSQLVSDLTVETEVDYIVLSMRGGPSARNSVLNVTYPNSILVTDTALVQFEYSVEYMYVNQPANSSLGYIGDIGDFKEIENHIGSKSTLKTIVEEVELLEYPASFEFSSSGFEIAPQESIVAATDTELPFLGAWTISPKGTGKKKIIIKLDEKDYRSTLNDLDHDIEQKITMNDNPVESVASGFYTIEIDVTTIWGISERAVKIVSGIIAFFGFLLVWKPLEILFKRIVGTES